MKNDVKRQRLAAGMDTGGGVYDVDAIAALLAGDSVSGRTQGAAPDTLRDKALDRAIGNALDSAIGLAAEGAARGAGALDGTPDNPAAYGGWEDTGVGESGIAGFGDDESGMDEAGVGGPGCGGPGCGGPGTAGQDGDIPMPAGWDRALWQGLSPEVRAVINAGEQAHAQALAQARAARQAERQLEDAFAVAANAQIQQALSTMKHIVEGEYGAVDWQELAQRDPATYVRLQRACNARMDAIRRVQQGVERQTREYEARRAAQARQAVADEFAVVQPEIRAMLGAAFNGRQFAEDVASYMHEQGCPAEVINNLSKGYELKLVAKAMLYDRLQTQRAAAARKLAQAPTVQPPRGASLADSHSRARQALSRLNRDPNSTDALAALFEATM